MGINVFFVIIIGFVFNLFWVFGIYGFNIVVVICDIIFIELNLDNLFYVV